MKRHRYLRHIFVRGIALAAGYLLVFYVAHSLDINTWIGENTDYDPASFRYKIGFWIEDRLMSTLTVPLIPAIPLTRALHHRCSELWVVVPYCIVLGLLISFLIASVSIWFHRAPKPIRVRVQKVLPNAKMLSNQSLLPTGMSPATSNPKPPCRPAAE